MQAKPAAITQPALRSYIAFVITPNNPLLQWELNCDVFTFSNVKLQNATFSSHCYTAYRTSNSRCSNFCAFLFFCFLFCLICNLIVLINDIRCNRCQRINSLGQCGTIQISILRLYSSTHGALRYIEKAYHNK